MKLSQDETRALGFVALLLALAGAARLLDRPERLEADTAAIDVAALAASSGRELAEEERRSRPLAPGERIDPNTASAAELDRLPRIGRVLAGRIVASREADGPFATAAALDRVAGIGERTVEILAPHLTFSGGAAAGAGAGAPLHPGSVLRARGPEPAAAEPSAALALDPNTASAAELERLPGIGPVLARRIIAYRDSAGGFDSIEALSRVSGIGPATLEALRPHVRLPP